MTQARLTIFKTGPKTTSSCTRISGYPKVAYTSRTEAESRIAPTLEIEYPTRDHRPMMAYRCRTCELWHLGHGPYLPSPSWHRKMRAIGFNEALHIELGDRVIGCLHVQNKRGGAKVKKALIERANRDSNN